MAPQTTKAWIPAPQITNCLFFGPLRQFVPSKWTELSHVPCTDSFSTKTQKYPPLTLKFHPFFSQSLNTIAGHMAGSPYCQVMDEEGATGGSAVPATDEALDEEVTDTE